MLDSLLTFCCVALAGLGCFIAYEAKSSTMSLLGKIKYCFLVNFIGFLFLLEDYYTRATNVLGKLPDKRGRVAVVTGGSRGLGVDVVKVLLKTGMKVVIGIRNVEAGKKMEENFKKEGVQGNLDIQKLDVSSLNSVRTFAKIVTKENPTIDLLVNNAGVMYGPRKLTEDGFESQLGTNYIGHFLLTHLLLLNLKKAGEKGEGYSRIVNVSSCAHIPGKIFFDDIHMKNDYNTWAAYSQSKIAQIMFTRHLERSLSSQSAKVHCYAVHPGIVDTDLFNTEGAARSFQTLLYKTPLQGATSVLYPCLAAEAETLGGRYFSNCREGWSNAYSKKEDKQRKLFDLTCDMVQIKQFGVVE